MKTILISLLLFLSTFLSAQIIPDSLNSTEITIDTIDINVNMNMVVDQVEYSDQNKEFLAELVTMIRTSNDIDINQSEMLLKYLVYEITNSKEKYLSKLDFLEQKYHYTNKEINNIIKRRNDIRMYTLIAFLISMWFSVYKYITYLNNSSKVNYRPLSVMLLYILLLTLALALGLNYVLQLIFNPDYFNLQHAITLAP